MKQMWPFYLIVVSIFFGAVSFDLFSDGMFFDGVYYANFAKVMGSHFESLWTVKHCASCANLYGHPPLAFFLESLPFRMFGDSMYIERFYSVSTYIVTGFLIYKVFKEIRPNKKTSSWAILLLFLSIPLIVWGASNNMLENTMMVFIMLSVLFSLKSLKNGQYLYISFSGMFIFLAFLTKGPVALFPLMFFLLYFVIFKKISFLKMTGSSLVLLLSFLLPLVCIYFFDAEGWAFLTNYIDVQVVKSINSIQTVPNRFYILVRTFNEILPPLILVILTLFFYRKKVSFKTWKEDYNWSMFFIILALIGIVPMMISLKQSGFYIISTLPLFALGFGFIILDQIELISTGVLRKTSFKRLKITSIVLFIISLGLNIYQSGKIGRDVEKLEAVYSVVQYVNTGEILTIAHDMYSDWSLRAYFYRNGGVSLSSDQKNLQEYLLIEEAKKFELIEKYTLVELKLKNYNLYKLKK